MDWRRDGMADLARQGFMKPRKRKMTTFYSVWIDDEQVGRCVCHKGTNEQSAQRVAAMFKGTITKSRELD